MTQTAANDVAHTTATAYTTDGEARATGRASVPPYGASPAATQPCPAATAGHSRRGGRRNGYTAATGGRGRPNDAPSPATDDR